MSFPQPSQNHNSENPPLFTTPAAAEHLGLSPRTLENLRHRGGGPRYVKLGGSVRYRAVDLDAWVIEGLRESTSPMSAFGG
ncbi:helix-turn-helix domain-containing protein [Patescibacteria group bacterium]|nr:helix-turn-helix domain-containing protein [Patescibacteria group bacterium]